MKKLVLFLALLSLGSMVNAQWQQTKGTDFWFGFMENYLGDDDPQSPTDKMAVYITAENDSATGNVSVPLFLWSQNFAISPHTTVEIIIPTDTVMCNLSDTIENKGIHVISDNPVTVSQLNYVQYTSDANIVSPTTALGKEYMVTTYNSCNALYTWAEVSISELLIVAVTDTTQIQITPTCNTAGGQAAGVPFTIVLNQGEVYQLQSNNEYPLSNSLTGSYIEGKNCRPFAVFAGNKCAFIPGDSCCCNHLCEQMIPIGKWGKEYITIPLSTRGFDVHRVVASENGTSFTINGGSPHTIGTGSYYEFNSSAPAYFQSNKPISITQFGISGDSDGNINSDPTMIMATPLDQLVKSLSFNIITSPILTSDYINIIAQTSDINSVHLDGIVIYTSFAPVSGNPLFSYAQLSIPPGIHLLSSNHGVMANIYGFGWFEAYGAIAGSAMNDLNNYFNIITQQDSFIYYSFSDSICMDSLVTFEAISDSSISDHAWNFGDSSSIEQGQTVTHIYTNPGNYIVTYYFQTSDCGLDSILWNIHVGDCFGLSINNQFANESFIVFIFPNPATNNLTIETPQKAIIEILSIHGQLIKTNVANDTKTNIDVSGLSAGVYIVQVRTEKGMAVRKFVKE